MTKGGMLSSESNRRLSAHRWHQHAPTPLDWHGDVCCSTVRQHIRRSVFRNGWATPVELITF